MNPTIPETATEARAPLREPAPHQSPPDGTGPKPGAVRRIAGGMAVRAGRLGWRLNLILLLATLVSTTICGALFFADIPESVVGTPGPAPWTLLLAGLSYGVPVLLILGSHEMGHYLLCRRYGVDATLPYFIPAPFLFGTMGAVIRMKPPLPGRKALFDIGIAGPIAGFVVAVPVLAYGIATARFEPSPQAPGEYLVFGDPLLVRILAGLFHGAVPDGKMLVGNPLMTAGWFGLLVTAMNLFPVGQLDGGHVVFALSARLHRVLMRTTIGGMIGLVAWSLASELAAPRLGETAASLLAGLPSALLAILLYATWRRIPPPWSRAIGLAVVVLVATCVARGAFSPWLVWTLVLLFLGRLPHPPLEAAQEPVGFLRRALALVALAIFLLSFIPVPIESVVVPG